MTSFNLDTLAAGILVLFDDYSRQKIEHIKVKHEIKGECAQFHMGYDEFSGFIMWLMVRKKDEDGTTKIRKPRNSRKRVDSPKAR